MREIRELVSYRDHPSLLVQQSATRTRKPLALMAYISINSLYKLIYLILIYLWDIFFHDDTFSAAHIEKKKIPHSELY